ncbi:MAG: sulfite exporter TauE/SafE family protein [Gemmatimonadetes bacterium]|nr:sulfite exporter TauE/SafE family protein [Gemmatimonadota bacterium]
MTAGALAALLLGGVAVGVVAGLFGIGGGVLIVPLLYFLYEHPGWGGTAIAPALHAVIAHATSLFIIVPTAVRGTVSYHRAGLVAWRAALPIALASALAAAFGTQVALRLPAALLKVLFGTFLLATALQLLRRAGGEHRHTLRLSPAVTLLTGMLVGLVSATLGVGGGLVAIPLLVHFVGLELRRVAATSLVVAAFAATAGSFSYMLSGWGAAGLPRGSVGYVHVLAALPIVAGSLLSVPWGVRVNQRLSTRALRVAFAVLLVALGGRLILTNL